MPGASGPTQEQAPSLGSNGRWLVHRWSLLWGQLTEPSPRLQDPELRRRARLLSAILAAVLPVSVVAALVTPTLTHGGLWNPMENPVALVGLTACLLGVGVYALSRTHRFEDAAFLTVAVAVYGTWGGALVSAGTTDHAATLYFLSLPVLLSSALLSMPFTAILALLNVGALLLMPLWAPAYTYLAIVNPVIFLVFSSALMVAFAAVRHADLRTIEQHAEALGESEAWWRSLVENAPGAILAVDLDGALLFFNDAFPSLDGRRAIGTPLEHYLPADQRQNFRQRLQEVVETGEPQRFQMAPLDPDGDRRPRDHRLGPLCHGDRVVGALLVRADDELASNG